MWSGLSASRPATLIGAALLLVILAIWWSLMGEHSVVVIYFGRPWDLAFYIWHNRGELFGSSARCFAVAVLSLLLAALLSSLLLTIGILWKAGLDVIERVAAVTQTVPMLVIVLIFLLLERQLFSMLSIQPTAVYFCVLPVTVSLIFPPLANGVGAVRRIPHSVRGLLRIWDAPRLWSFRKVLLPIVIPDILIGIVTSSTWAVGATLITEGLLNGVSGDSDSLGFVLARPFTSQHAGQTPAVVLIAIVLGYMVYALFKAAQKFTEVRLLGRTIAAERDFAFYTFATGGDE